MPDITRLLANNAVLQADPINPRVLQYQPHQQLTPMQAVGNYFNDVVSRLPKIPSEYEAGARGAQNAMVNLVLGGSTPSPQMMRGEVDLVENPEAEAIEPAFMGMDTLTSAAVPKALQGYIKLAAKMAPDEQTFIKYLERAGVSNPQKYMTAFHGSPHKFSKFELENIGTGEGGQAFGHGLYFAENPNTAKSYLPKGADVEAFKLKETGEIIGKDSPKYHDIADTMDRMIANGYGDDFLSQVELKGGNLYEVDIPDSAIDNMLDWDKPLSEQPESVRKALKPIREQIRKSFPEYADNDDILGEGLYRMLSEHRGMNQQVASEYLNSLGIPGIRYLDQGSRAAGEGTRNFVVFDSDIVDVLKRNGEPVKLSKSNKLDDYDYDFPLTHESSDAGFNGEIGEGDVFNGVFAMEGEKGSALGPGGYHITYIPRKGKVAGHGDYDLDYDKTMSFLKREYPAATEEQRDLLYKFTADDVDFSDYLSEEDIYNISQGKSHILEDLAPHDIGEASWEFQNIRGKIAADQGYDAIAMSDENGTSYFIPRGSKAKILNE